MALFLFWKRQSQLRVLSHQLRKCYFQFDGSTSVAQNVVTGVVNNRIWDFRKTGYDFGKNVRCFAAPVQVQPKDDGKDKGRPRINEQIKAEFVRLVTDQGHGVISRREALERARRLEVDLVEVQADAKPPVCKIMDYNKEMYMRQVKEKEQTKKKKSELVLRGGSLKEVRLTSKIDKNDLQTKADTVKRLTERGYRVKCMAVGKEDQDLGGLLSSISVLLDDFCLVESGPIVEAKQAYIVVRHVKFGPLKKGPKKVVTPANAKTSTENPENLKRDLEEEQSDSETEDVLPEESPMLDAPDNSNQVLKLRSSTTEAHDSMKTSAPETSNRHRSEPENRYAATRQTNSSVPQPENRYAPTRQANASASGPENRYASTRQTNASASGPENRYASTRQTNTSFPHIRTPRKFESQSQNSGRNRQFDFNNPGPPRETKLVDTEAATSPRSSSYGMFSTPKVSDTQRESRPAKANRYKK